MGTLRLLLRAQKKKPLRKRQKPSVSDISGCKSSLDRAAILRGQLCGDVPQTLSQRVNITRFSLSANTDDETSAEGRTRSHRPRANTDAGHFSSPTLLHPPPPAAPDHPVLPMSQISESLEDTILQQSHPTPPEGADQNLLMPPAATYTTPAISRSQCKISEDSGTESNPLPATDVVALKNPSHSSQGDSTITSGRRPSQPSALAQSCLRRRPSDPDCSLVPRASAVPASSPMEGGDSADSLPEERDLVPPLPLPLAGLTLNQPTESGTVIRSGRFRRHSGYPGGRATSHKAVAGKESAICRDSTIPGSTAGEFYAGPQPRREPQCFKDSRGSVRGDARRRSSQRHQPPQPPPPWSRLAVEKATFGVVPRSLSVVPEERRVSCDPLWENGAATARRLVACEAVDTAVGLAIHAVLTSQTEESEYSSTMGSELGCEVFANIVNKVVAARPGVRDWATARAAEATVEEATRHALASVAALARSTDALSSIPSSEAGTEDWAADDSPAGKDGCEVGEPADMDATPAVEDAFVEGSAPTAVEEDFTAKDCSEDAASLTVEPTAKASALGSNIAAENNTCAVNEPVAATLASDVAVDTDMVAQGSPEATNPSISTTAIEVTSDNALHTTTTSYEPTNATLASNEESVKPLADPVAFSSRRVEEAALKLFEEDQQRIRDKLREEMEAVAREAKEQLEGERRRLAMEWERLEAERRAAAADVETKLREERERVAEERRRVVVEKEKLAAEKARLEEEKNLIAQSHVSHAVPLGIRQSLSARSERPSDSLSVEMSPSVPSLPSCAAVVHPPPCSPDRMRGGPTLRRRRLLRETRSLTDHLLDEDHTRLSPRRPGQQTDPLAVGSHGESIRLNRAPGEPLVHPSPPPNPPPPLAAAIQRGGGIPVGLNPTGVDTLNRPTADAISSVAAASSSEVGVDGCGPLESVEGPAEEVPLEMAVPTTSASHVSPDGDISSSTAPAVCPTGNNTPLTSEGHKNVPGGSVKADETIGTGFEDSDPVAPGSHPYLHIADDDDDDVVDVVDDDDGERDDVNGYPPQTTRYAAESPSVCDEHIERRHFGATHARPQSARARLRSSSDVSAEFPVPPPVRQAITPTPPPHPTFQSTPAPVMRHHTYSSSGVSATTSMGTPTSHTDPPLTSPVVPGPPKERPKFRRARPQSAGVVPSTLSSESRTVVAEPDTPTRPMSAKYVSDWRAGPFDAPTEDVNRPLSPPLPEPAVISSDPAPQRLQGLEPRPSKQAWAEPVPTTESPSPATHSTTPTSRKSSVGSDGLLEAARPASAPSAREGRHGRLSASAAASVQDNQQPLAANGEVVSTFPGRSGGGGKRRKSSGGKCETTLVVINGRSSKSRPRDARLWKPPRCETTAHAQAGIERAKMSSMWRQRLQEARKQNNDRRKVVMQKVNTTLAERYYARIEEQRRRAAELPPEQAGKLHMRTAVRELMNPGPRSKGTSPLSQTSRHLTLPDRSALLQASEKASAVQGLSATTGHAELRSMLASSSMGLGPRGVEGGGQRTDGSSQAGHSGGRSASITSIASSNSEEAIKQAEQFMGCMVGEPEKTSLLEKKYGEGIARAKALREWRENKVVKSIAEERFEPGVIWPLRKVDSILIRQKEEDQRRDKRDRILEGQQLGRERAERFVYEGRLKVDHERKARDAHKLTCLDELRHVQQQQGERIKQLREALGLKPVSVHVGPAADDENAVVYSDGLEEDLTPEEEMIRQRDELITKLQMMMHERQQERIRTVTLQEPSAAVLEAR
eukprot:Rmarinus@m.9839